MGCISSIDPSHLAETYSRVRVGRGADVPRAEPLPSKALVIEAGLSGMGRPPFSMDVMDLEPTSHLFLKVT